MPFITLDQLGIDPHIWMNIDDVVIDGTRRKFKAEVLVQEYNPRDKYVTVKVMLYPYSAILNEDGTTSYGISLANVGGFSAEENMLIANDTTLVNMADGHILGNTQELIGTPELQAENEAEGGPLHGINYCGEYTFFKYLSVTTPIKVEEMIIGKVIAKFGDGTSVRDLTPTTTTTTTLNENESTTTTTTSA